MATVYLDGRTLEYNEMIALAWADGFTGFDGLTLFLEWFETHYGLPFEGVVISW